MLSATSVVLVLICFANILNGKCIPRKSATEAGTGSGCSGYSTMTRCKANDATCLWNPNGINLESRFVASITLTRCTDAPIEPRPTHSFHTLTPEQADRINSITPRQYIERITALSRDLQGTCYKIKYDADKLLGELGLEEHASVPLVAIDPRITGIKEIKGEKSTSQIKGHKGSKPHQMIPVDNRQALHGFGRRLLAMGLTANNDLNNNPARSFGYLVRAGGGDAGATIVRTVAGNPVRRNNPHDIWVLTAAHNIGPGGGPAMYAPGLFTFYPKLNQLADPNFGVGVAAGSLALTPAQHQWMLDDWALVAGGIDANDVGLLMFHGPSNLHHIRVASDTRIPAIGAGGSMRTEFYAYKMPQPAVMTTTVPAVQMLPALVAGGNANNGNGYMRHGRVDLRCGPNLCEHRSQRIYPGMCGGPAIKYGDGNNKILAVQATISGGVPYANAAWRAYLPRLNDARIALIAPVAGLRIMRPNLNMRHTNAHQLYNNRIYNMYAYQSEESADESDKSEYLLPYYTAPVLIENNTSNLLLYLGFSIVFIALCIMYCIIGCIGGGICGVTIQKLKLSGKPNETENVV